MDTDHAKVGISQDQILIYIKSGNILRKLGENWGKIINKIGTNWNFHIVSIETASTLSIECYNVDFDYGMYIFKDSGNMYYVDSSFPCKIFNSYSI